MISSCVGVSSTLVLPGCTVGNALTGAFGSTSGRGLLGVTNEASTIVGCPCGATPGVHVPLTLRTFVVVGDGTNLSGFAGVANIFDDDEGCDNIEVAEKKSNDDAV